MAQPVGAYPYQVPITAYGNGGFRFAEMSHRGSLLCLPTGIFAWPVTEFGEVAPDHFEAALDVLESPAVLLFGTGSTHQWPADSIEKAFVEHGIGLESMSTGAAARTYNVLLAEKRSVAAALIAVS